LFHLFQFTHVYVLVYAHMHIHTLAMQILEFSGKFVLNDLY